MTTARLLSIAPNPDWIERDRAAAKRVFELAIESLSQMSFTIADSLPEVVEMINAAKNDRAGRVIVTGMGKSGHVARKMAATLSSTGTPSMFVHPGEASHGDLGMITEHDVVIALSNSGEAPELSDITIYTRRYNIPLVAVTGKANSTLGKAADVVLIIPDVPEACPNGLAPTTSTTAMLALGDAIAMALLERSGLTAADYKVFHPGGKLGARLMTVRQLMHQRVDLPVVMPGTKMADALIVMAEKNLGGVIVIDEEDHILGLITDGDLKRHMDTHLLERRVETIMTTNPKAISPDILAAEAVHIMLTAFKNPITSLLVVENDRLAGLIQLQSCYAAGVV